MNQEQPTQEQIKEFWEWCGFKEGDSSHKSGYDIYKPDRCYYGVSFPDLDLNNLFKYAVPKLDYIKVFHASHHTDYGAEVSIEGKEKIQRLNPDPALALFWAIKEAIKK